MIIPGAYIDGFITVDSSNEIVAWANGLPYVESGSLAIGSAPITHWNQGVPFNADGRVVSSSNTPAVYQCGYAFDSDGAWCVFEGVDSFGLLDVDLDEDSIPESAEIGDPVGIQVVGNFPGVNPVTYSITSQSLPGAFQIDASTGVITVATAGLLDYETSTSETVTVRATDTVTEAYVEETYTINLVDVIANLGELWGADRLVWITESGVEPSVWRI